MCFEYDIQNKIFITLQNMLYFRHLREKQFDTLLQNIKWVHIQKR